MCKSAAFPRAAGGAINSLGCAQGRPLDRPRVRARMVYFRNSGATVKTPCVLVALGLLFCFPAWAQNTATIVGTVIDSSGGVIPGAKVTVSNPEKGFTRELSTNTAGEYTAPKVPIGDYAITAENEGFQRLVRSGITLAVGQTLHVDLQLQVGPTTQEVTVAGNAPRVDGDGCRLGCGRGNANFRSWTVHPLEGEEMRSQGAGPKASDGKQ